jgi:protein-L-isoaspartate O-methyltransferase
LADGFAALPPVAGQTVLDLGCGVGDLAAELAPVTGIPHDCAVRRELHVAGAIRGWRISLANAPGRSGPTFL